MLDAINSLNEWQFYLFLFAVFAVLGLISRGVKAVKWTRDEAVSRIANLAFFKLTFFYSGLFFFVLPLLQGWYEAQGFPQVSREFWDGIPLPLTGLLLLLMYDFTLYWAHRLLHHPLFWPSHAVHHSDEHMNFLTWSRGHPAEQIVIVIALLFSSTWMGIKIEEIAGLAILRSLHQYYVHENLDWDHGPLHYVLVSPRFHRWHHVDHQDAWDKNFASIFPFLDKMFGTYYNPHPSVDMPTGIGEHTPGNNIIALTTWPFMEWGSMIAGKLKSVKEKRPLTPVED